MDNKDLKVVFLDIDGVLNNGPYDWSRHLSFKKTEWVDTSLRSKLSHWASHHGIKFVGVSSWFIGCDSNEIQEIAAFLEIPIIGITDKCGGGYGRGIGVLDYVEKHSLTHWVVLDDAGAGMYAFPTIIVNARTGLTTFDLDFAELMIKNGHDKFETAYYRECQEVALAQQNGNRK